MMTLAYIAGSLMDPVAMLVGLLVGALSRKWAHMFVAIFVVWVGGDFALSLLLSGTRPSQYLQFDLATAIWATLVFGARSIQRSRKKKTPIDQS